MASQEGNREGEEEVVNVMSIRKAPSGRKYRIAILGGDGIGPEVMDAARIVLDKLQLNAEYIPGDIGWHFWCNEGNAFPQRTIDLLKNTDCALFGAITSKPKGEANKEIRDDLRGKFTYTSPIVLMRQMFNLYVNMRPCQAYKGNPLNFKDNIDLVIFRENTEGLYAGIEFRPVKKELRQEMAKYSAAIKKFDHIADEDMAVTLRLITRIGSERIVRAAFEYAKKNGKKHVTVSEKPNVLRETSGLFVESARKIAKDYPDIKLRETNIDAQCMLLVQCPEDYGVIVCSNLFGDILSDLASQLIGGLGFAPSANIGPNYAVFEPTHGSAPTIAGKNIANPTAMLLTVQLMLEWLNEKVLAERLLKAVSEVIAEGKVRTADAGGNSSTTDVAKAVAAKL